MTRLRRGGDLRHGDSGGDGGSAGNGRNGRDGAGDAAEFDDPRLRAQLQSLLAGTKAPESMVRAVERQARRLPVASSMRNPWAEFVPAIASMALVGSLLVGAMSSLPVGAGLLHLASGGGESVMLSPVLALGAVAMPLVGWLSVRLLRATMRR